MSLYRCAACGSPNVVTDTQSGGIKYNYVKGAIGTVALGAGGAAAGITSETQRVFKCPDCGVTLTYPMETWMKNAIDAGVSSLEARRNLPSGVAGFRTSWDILTRQYRNIEKGSADEELMREAEENNITISELISGAEATKEEFDAAFDYICEIESKLVGGLGKKIQFFTRKNPMTLEEYYAWRSAILVFIENLPKFLPSPLPKQYRSCQYLDYFVVGCFYDYLVDQIEAEASEAMEKRYKEKGEEPPHRYSQFMWTYEAPTVTHPSRGRFEGVDQFNIYAATHNFVYKFLKAYATSFEIDYGRMMSEKSDGENYPNIHRCLYKHQSVSFKMVSNSEKFFHETASINEFYLPRFKVENGKLWYWDYSFVRDSEKNSSRYSDIIKNYFSYYPEKKEKYDSIIEEQQKCLKQFENAQQEIPNHEKTITDAQSEIELLQKKVFGKKKAQERIDILQTNIKDAEKAIMVLKEQSAKLFEKYPTEEYYSNGKERRIDEKLKIASLNFFEELARRFNFFIAWHPVEETLTANNPEEE